ncbi:hypothetical protein LPB03_06195 [Polaribacter vadi]|uniref:YcxB-like protein domain-containing protein n=1 Tax=Polaribacter vadi TaxID=1774273 RepID=A0A1B8TZK4_9FLAO|nr:hypothetical protein [Polaribacter vadi]AOW17075.1 hypothetical protein LPB03_06195 [Polaribacter vadi]OBY64995.1 hypothetical protein LPB3_06290 [Polaribacter vadi]
MKIESKLNESSFRKSQKINLDFVFGKKLKSVKQNLILLFFVLIISLELTSKEIILGYIFLGFALMFLINIIWFYYSYFKIKKQHLKNIETEISHYKNNPDKSIISEFRNDSFYYKDYKMEFTLIWEKFESFQIIDDYLVLKSFGANYLNFFFNKHEISSEEFDKIIIITRNNIKNKK